MTLKTRGRWISANRYHADSMMTSRPRIPRFLLVAMLMCIPACSQRHEAAFGGLEQGMTRDQVRDLLGPPSTTYYATEDLRVEAGGVYPERWQYGDNISTRATGAMFPESAPDRVWVVVFEDGRVASFREPRPADDPWRGDK